MGFAHSAKFMAFFDAKLNAGGRLTTQETFWRSFIAASD